jgi:hypothetical protein
MVTGAPRSGTARFGLLNVSTSMAAAWSPSPTRTLKRTTEPRNATSVTLAEITLWPGLAAPPPPSTRVIISGRRATLTTSPAAPLTGEVVRMC